MQDFTKSKVSRHAGWLQFDAVAEVLFSFLVVTTVGKLGCQVDARAEVRLVEKQALFEVIDGKLEIFKFFVLTAQKEVGVDIAFLVIFVLV